MNSFEIVKLRERPDLKGQAAPWFHEKWGAPLEAYAESLDACLDGGGSVPQWYAAVAEDRIVAGLGVIENDFHCRRDLTPNVCAVYVEEDCRRRGLAGEMLAFACRDMADMGISTLYLITDHDSFYERYGWEFLCMVRDSQGEMTRMYIHREGAHHEDRDLHLGL